MALNRRVDEYKDEIIKSTQKLISIPSVKGKPEEGKPFGKDIHRALDYVLNLGKELGFNVGNVDGYAGFIEFGQGEETFGILTHIDVVPQGEDWTYPPFGGEIHNNKIYGRGAIDDKGPTIAALFAMKAVMDSDISINKKIRLIMGTDEESGWEDMDYYFKKHPMPDFGVTPDANYPVIHAEKGIIAVEFTKEFEIDDRDKTPIISIKGGSSVNMVPDRCTCILEEKEVLVSQGVSAHGSTPERGDNAIVKVLEELYRRGLGDNPIDKFVEDIYKILGQDTKGTGLGIDLSDDVSGDLTLNLGIINIDENMGKVVVDIRYPVTYREKEILERIERALRGTDIKIQGQNGKKPLHVPKDHFLVQSLLRVYKEQTGDDLAPLSIGGGTFARALDTGVAFGAVFPGEEELAHQKDEYIDIDNLMLNAKIYAHAIAELAR